MDGIFTLFLFSEKIRMKRENKKKRQREGEITRKKNDHSLERFRSSGVLGARSLAQKHFLISQGKGEQKKDSMATNDAFKCL